MSSSIRRLALSYRVISLVVYLGDILIALRFAVISREYLEVLCASLTTFFSVVMAFVAINSPHKLIQWAERSRFGEIFFWTYRGRFFVDLIISLLLTAMGVWGIIMGCVTLVLILDLGLLGVRKPEAFSQLFRESTVAAEEKDYARDDESEEEEGDDYKLEADDQDTVESR